MGLSFRLPDRVSRVSHGMNEERRPDFFPEPAYENLHELRVVFVFPLPDPFA